MDGSVNRSLLLQIAQQKPQEYKWKYAVLTILGFVGQLIFLPLWIATISDVADPYFVIWVASGAFNVIFWPVVYYKKKHGDITDEQINYPNHWKLVCIGVFDALNGQTLNNILDYISLSTPLFYFYHACFHFFQLDMFVGCALFQGFSLSSPVPARAHPLSSKLSWLR